MDRAYSVLHVKSVQEDARIIRGVATTPTPDRVGDIVESLGVEFKNPLPLLWQHDSKQPVGTVKFQKPTKDGIEFEAKIARIKEPGALQNEIDKVWQYVKEGLVRAVSIGFRPIEYAMIETGIHFLKSEVYELSLVTIPANAQATITQIKSIDTGVRAALGIRDAGTDRLHPPGASGSPHPKNRQEAKMNTSEKIAALEARRTERIKSWEDLKDLDTKSVEQKALIKQYREEVENLDEEIDDERAFEKTIAGKAKAVDESRGRYVVPAQAKKAKPELEPGVLFAQLFKCRTLSKVHFQPLETVARGMYGEDSEIYEVIKANEVTPGTAASGNWGYDLISQEGAPAAGFIPYLRAKTIVGKFGANGVPSLDTGINFYDPYVTQTAGGAGYWVGEGATKPLTTFDFDRATVLPLKMANIVALTNENIKRSSPKSDTVVRDALVAALVELEDQSFIDPGNSGTSNIKPASITNGAEAIAASGSGDADDIILDLRALFNKFDTANNDPTGGVLVMSPKNARAAGMMLNALGQPQFPTLTVTGGNIMGVPVIVSNYASTNITMLNAPDIYYIDEGFMVDASDQVSLEMRTIPTGSGATPTHVSLVSMWQNNMIAFRAEKTVNWKRKRTSAVAYLTGASWGGSVPES